MTSRPVQRCSLIGLHAIVACAILFVPVGTAPAAFAGDDVQTTFEGMLSRGRTFSEQGGESLYANVCSGCHMRDARGAVGAGAYPSLVEDGNLTVDYTLRAVVAGLRGMPAIGRAMTDDQVATVVNYVRTHFGNRYSDAVTPEDVKHVRP